MLIFILFVCSACSQSLRTLITVSNEQKSQAAYLAAQEKNLKILINDIERQKIKGGITRAYCIDRYGEPISQRQEDNQTVLLYRHPRDFFPSEKVYLYFGEDGLLRKWNYLRQEENPLQ